MSSNVYSQSTAHITKKLPKLTREQALKKVSGPAISLIVVSGLVLATILIGSFIYGYNATMDLMYAEKKAPLVKQENETPEELRERERKIKQEESEKSFLTFSLVALIGLGVLLSNAVVLAGALSMLQLKSRRMSSAAAAFAVIPVLSPALLLGVPFGIWAMIVINNKEVRRYFKS